MSFFAHLGIDPEEVVRLAARLDHSRTFDVDQHISTSETLTLAQVCEAVSSANPPRENLELTTRDRQLVPQDEYLPVEAGRIDPGTLERAVSAGATMMITNVAQWSDELNRFPMSRDASFEVNLFLSGPLCQAYPAHFDLLDAVIIQIVGSKGWQLWNTLEGGAVDTSTFRTDQFGPPTTSTLLASGDVLLMPARTPHLVASTFSPSVHLAVAMRDTDAR
ncbi:JmjC domain-containing protein [Microbacterium gorillae]|uniref:JmjC domain-containing protein n=1 Tax=Microbacterium gorillae TaxID=1231063 RepID=UPI003D99F73D